MEHCINHPGKKALSVCHGCGKNFCEVCLDEGREFYYCKNPACQELLKKDKKVELLPEKMMCPVCSSELELSNEDRTSKKFHCPECKSFVDLTEDPPKIWDDKNYLLLLTTMNQGDIAVIKSLLDNANIDYYAFDEDFLSMRPLVQPARFFVAESDVEKAKEIMESLNLNFFGITRRNKIEE
ncbi:MAG TPA: DUF2007 domain-containing protein [Candidatus Acidoferrales bacterium]|nr:DUF2007 domain-containing protein [Candidatus Acidoferrales bacterium]